LDLPDPVTVVGLCMCVKGGGGERRGDREMGQGEEGREAGRAEGKREMS
jgi:hypothetical protein